MPEGDTLYRTAAGLRPYLQGRKVLRARAPRPGPQIERVVGSTIASVEARGKHLIMSFDNGLALHTHLRMYGSWHRYASGERWRRPSWQARAVLEVPGSVAVCFNAPVVELLEERALAIHPSLAQLGPDLLAAEFDAEAALQRLRSPARAQLSVGEALLDQRALAGVGNVFKSEILFIERLDPWTRLSGLDDETLRRILATAERLLRANVAPGVRGRVTTGQSGIARGSSLWVYGRSGLPCLRCRARINSQLQGDPPRRTYWCPRCQR